ncbi:MAG TPA: aminopeptidase N [Candidatus Dormibacteraeota bacterium]|nr:aminopeptidase N [Candidatus Dormibacteraeota bacterium]
MTRREAQERADLITVRQYDVSLDFTTGDQTFGSITTVTFGCRASGSSTFIEFAGSIRRAELNGYALPDLEGGRLRLDGLAAENSLTIEGLGSYTHDGSGGISFFRDPVDGRTYLHSQFSEHAAYKGYACFDQPDLKATFAFRVKAPQGWVVVSNTPGNRSADGVWTFPTTTLMSTYVTAIVAGEYHAVRQDHRGIPLGLYCRQSLAEYLDPDEFFEITRQGFDFFERRFGYPYPFGKYDQLYVPEFTGGAMENVGCVTFNERRLFRSKVTEARRMDRAETILHEMAHMWFGDLVTMRWWDDLWLNESFAEYMGYLSTVDATRFKTAWIEFAVATKDGARRQDQLPTTHPIVADIPDVEAVYMNLDFITYNKGAAALQQLVVWVGEEPFFKGIEEYFRKHAFGNTDLKDLLAALEDASGRDLKAWSRAWLETAGVNTIEARVQVKDGVISSADLIQTALADHPTLRPHRLRVGLFDAVDGQLRRRRSVELDVEGAVTPMPQLAGEHVPDLVLPNDGDLTYCKVRLDGHSLETLKLHLRGIDDPLARAIAWGALWDMARDAEFRARDYIAISLANIEPETDASTLESLIGRTERAVDSFSEPSHRATVRELLARASKEHMSRSQPGSDVQLLWANTFINTARTLADVGWVLSLLDGTTSPEGLVVDFEIRWRAVTALATIGAADEELIALELERDPTDEGRRRAAGARAALPLMSAKQRAWEAAVDGGTPSLQMKRAIAGAFHHVDQQELLKAFVKPFFDSLLPVWVANDSEVAISIVEWMYPRAVITQEVVDETDGALAKDLPGPIRRALLESQDAIRRALQAQAFDGSRSGVS